MFTQPGAPPSLTSLSGPGHCRKNRLYHAIPPMGLQVTCTHLVPSLPLSSRRSDTQTDSAAFCHSTFELKPERTDDTAALHLIQADPLKYGFGFVI